MRLKEPKIAGANASWADVNSKIASSIVEAKAKGATTDIPSTAKAAAEAKATPLPGGVKGLLEQISRGEGTSDAAAKKKGLASGYDVSLGYGAYGGGPKKALSEMTMAEVKEYQKAMLADPKNKMNSSAVGKYQLISGTLKELQKELGLKDTDKFDASTQDKMGEALLKRRGLDKYTSGKISAEKFQLGLSQEWASVADPRTGNGYYAGQRTAHTTDAMAKAAFAGLSGSTPTQTATPVQQTRPQEVPTAVASTKAPPVSPLPSHENLNKQIEAAREAVAAKQRAEKARQEAKAASGETKTADAGPAKKETSLSDVVDELHQLNTKITSLLTQHEEIGQAQIKASKSNNQNIFARA